jgi:hypothetical protein
VFVEGDGAYVDVVVDAEVQPPVPQVAALVDPVVV